jgi:hypothetical protein
MTTFDLLRSILILDGHEAIVLSDHARRWLLGHLRDEMPSLKELAHTPPFVRNGEALDCAREVISALEEVTE